MSFVLDASAMTALLEEEPGGAFVLAVILEEGFCSAHAMNVCETFYDIRRRKGENAAQWAVHHLQEIGVHICHDMDTRFWQEVGRLKSVYRRVSLADCCGLVLAARLEAEFLTSDSHELSALQNGDVCPVTFIR